MPVELPVRDPGKTPPSLPGVLVWLVLFIVFMLVGVGFALLTWTKGESTSTPWFWVNLLVYPALAWCGALGLRKLYYDQEMDRIDAEDETLQEDRQETIRFGREPLAVIASAYRCALDSGNGASAIVLGHTALKTQKTRFHNLPVRHTALVLPTDDPEQSRYSLLFMELIGSLHDVLAALPRDVPFNIRLQLPPDSQHDELMSLWEDCWREFKLRPVRPTLLPVEQGLIALDDWLDLYGGPELQKFTLFVAVQLHDTSPADSAEAGVALLLCWPLVAVRKKLTPMAMMHRPLETATVALNEDILTALLWGGAVPDEIFHVWQTGLDTEDKAALNRASLVLKLGVVSSEGLSGLHDVDNAVGYAGAAASWLAAALAIENAQQHQQPQMIVCREGALRLAIVQPIANENKVEATE